MQTLDQYAANNPPSWSVNTNPYNNAYMEAAASAIPSYINVPTHTSGVSGSYGSAASDIVWAVGDGRKKAIADKINAYCPPASFDADAVVWWPPEMGGIPGSPVFPTIDFPSVISINPSYIPSVIEFNLPTPANPGIDFNFSLPSTIPLVMPEFSYVPQPCSPMFPGILIKDVI